MKFLAILKDSLRETLDVKLFYVLVGLSLLTVLVVGSITYKPVSAQRYLEFTSDLGSQVASGRLREKNLRLLVQVENFKRLDSRSEPWLGDYQFDYVISLSSVNPPVGDGTGPLDKGDKDKTRQAIFAEEFRRFSEEIKREFGQLFSEVDVKEGVEEPDTQPGTGNLKIRFPVTTHNGTRIKNRQEWFHEPALFFGAVPIPIPLLTLGTIVKVIADYVVGSFGAMVTIVLSIVITAFFLPSMLAKGTVDMLVVKPIHRWTLLLYKFVGGLLFMFLNTVIIMVGIWLAIGLQTGTWLSSLLLCIFVFTFQFAIFYSVSAVTAVLTRSTIVCILASLMTLAVLTILGWAHWIFIESRREKAPLEVRTHWAFVAFDAFYSITPRYKDLDWLTSKMISKELIEIHADVPAEDLPGMPGSAQARQRIVKEVEQKQLEDLNRKYQGYSWTTSLSVTSLFIGLMVGLACWRFTVKDF